MLLCLGFPLLGASNAGAGGPACDPSFMPGIGFVCPHGDGLLEVIGTAGQSLGTTHGPDAIPGTVSGGDMSNPLGPACVTGSDFTTRVVYAIPSDGTDRYASQVGVIRQAVRQINQAFNEAGAAGGHSVDLRVECQGGEAVVEHETLPTSRSGATFASILSDLGQNAAYQNPRVKYLVFYDDSTPGDECNCAGMGERYQDSSPGSNNVHNGATTPDPMFAVTFGYFDWSTPAHELLHTMGAVQLDAPHATLPDPAKPADRQGGGHCYDGGDVMCYNDGGIHGLPQGTSCGGQPIDCGKDDYFNTNPPLGNYLVDHWNVGGVVNHFIVRDAGRPRMTQLDCTPQANIQAPVTCTLNSSDDGYVYYELDWGDGTTGRAPPEYYTVPNSPVTASHAYAFNGVYTVKATVADDGPYQLRSAVATAPVSIVTGNGPTVYLQSPRGGHVYTGCTSEGANSVDEDVFVDSGCVRLTASDPSGVRSVSVLLDGAQVAYSDTPVWSSYADATYEVVVPAGLLDVARGAASLQIVVTDNAWEETRLTRPVVLASSSNLASTAAAALDPPEVPNGGFDSPSTKTCPPDHWTYYEYNSGTDCMVSSPTRKGMGAVRITDGSSSLAAGIGSECLPISPGAYAYAGAWYRGEDAPQSGARLSLYVEFFDTPSGGPSGSRIGVAWAGTTVTTPSWRILHAGGTAPPGSVCARVTLYSDVAAVGTIYVDDVTLQH